MHLLGQSWGGILALQYALDHPDGREEPRPLEHRLEHRRDLPRHDPAQASTSARTTSRRWSMHEGKGDVESPEYEALVMQLYARHLRRSTPFEIERSIREFEEIMVPLMDLGPAYFQMWGPHEFLLTGTLADWDVTDRLGEIEVPALIVCGWYDEIDIRCHRILADGIRGQRVRHLRQLEPLHHPREGGRRLPRCRQGLRPPRAPPDQSQLGSGGWMGSSM